MLRYRITTCFLVGNQRVSHLFVPFEIIDDVFTVLIYSCGVDFAEFLIDSDHLNSHYHRIHAATKVLMLFI